MKLVSYTNSNCSDLWLPFIEQINKNCSIELFVITDKKIDLISEDNQYVYSNAEPYYKVWIDALNKFKCDYFIYLQEDFFLYSKVDTIKLEMFLEILKNNQNYSFIRLLKSGNLNNVEIFSNLFEIESNNEDIFSMQATIWNTNSYIKLMETVKDEKWLENYKYRNAAIDLNLKGLYYYNNEPKRGGAHYDSDVFPYIATALVRGQWNISEYNNELTKILNEYNIDINKRGIF